MTAPLRLIARLDIKGPNLIKSIQLEGLRVVGPPRDYARRYYHDGADELLYMDLVASLYGRDMLCDIVQRTAEEVFIPITVGGGVRSVDDARQLLLAGADKVALNTAATQRPELIAELAEVFGSQCVVIQLDAKRRPGGGWEALCEAGREHTGLDAVEWAKRCRDLGAGEILVTSVDQEGTGGGFDINLVRAVSDAVSIPVIASGGMGSLDHMVKVVRDGHADAVACARMLHYDKTSLTEMRKRAQAENFAVRTL